MDLSTLIEKVPRIGPVLQKRLRKLGIKTLGNLLYHLPLRYEDFSNFVPLAQLRPRTNVSIRGKILEIKSSLAWKKRLTLTQAVVGDQTGAVRVVWFAKPYITDILEAGSEVIMAGRVSQGKKGLYLNNPSYEKVPDKNSPFESSRVAGLMPVYPETERLSSRWLRSIIRPILANFKNQAQEFLPEKVLKEFDLLSFPRAIWQIHFPDSLVLAGKAKTRLAFEELFLIELFVLKERVKILQTKAHPIPIDLISIQKFVKSLPFTLTNAQRKSAWQILKDLEKSHPMNRLLEGEVGSGKTVVAALAALNCARADLQIALMAPTEILAKQHFKEVAKLLFDFKLTIALLTGQEDKIMAKKLKGEALEASRQKILAKCLDGQIDILIGTHALIQKSVRFKNLGLVIIDEQHRFGVEQRARLTQNAKRNLPAGGQNPNVPHLLTMTATPIPRSLALTVYGDLDLSIINELPKGRRKIVTEIVPPSERPRVYDFIRSQVELERQAFVICPRIEKNPEIQDTKYNPSTGSGLRLRGSDSRRLSRAKSRDKIRDTRYSSWADVKTVSEEKEKLAKEVFPDLRIEMLHGKMKPKEKEKIMRDFKNNKIKVLVATSVVEVGIDIPNASVMVIEGAERFGLAQLHQLRGRVGRAEHQSYCFLLTDSPARKTQQRLKAMVKAEDGFELAQKDLEIRGPGEFSGRKQWGLPDLAMESLKDLVLVAQCKTAAKEILEQDFSLKKYPLLRERLERFKEKIHLE